MTWFACHVQNTSTVTVFTEHVSIVHLDSDAAVLSMTSHKKPSWLGKYSIPGATSVLRTWELMQRILLPLLYCNPLLEPCWGLCSFIVANGKNVSPLLITRIHIGHTRLWSQEPEGDKIGYHTCMFAIKDDVPAFTTVACCSPTILKLVTNCHAACLFWSGLQTLHTHSFLDRHKDS